MVRDLINRYVWFVETIERYGRITRAELNRQWSKSRFSENGEGMPRRTFYNYRQGIEETFNIKILFDPGTYEYYIDSENDTPDSHRNKWLLETMSMNGILGDTEDINSRILLENVPSSRIHLSTIVQAMKQNRRVKFLYRTYSEVTAKERVVEPYFVKIFRRRWYLIGYNVADETIKTYALDRMRDVTIETVEFKYPANLRPDEFFSDCFGITTDHSTAEHIILRVDRWLANYLRALPWHHSQQEEIHEKYSLFHFKMKITEDLLEEIRRYGSNIEVVAPIELKVRVINDLEKALAHYK